VSNWLVYLRGEIDPITFIRKMYKARSYVELFRIDYGYEENPQGTRRPNSHFMVLYLTTFHYLYLLSVVFKSKYVCVWLLQRCCFELNTLDISWYKRIIGALKTIQGSEFFSRSSINLWKNVIFVLF